MAIFNQAVVDKRPVFAGTFGNKSIGVFKYTCAGEAIASEIIFGIVPKYATVTNVTMVNAALGASSTIAIGYRTAEVGGTMTAGAAYWIAATATSSAARTVSQASAVPIQLTEAAYVSGVVAGGTVTGDVYVVVDYVYASK